MSLATAAISSFTRETFENVGIHRLGVHAFCHCCGRKFDREEPRYICDTLRSVWPQKSISFYYFHVGCGCGAGDGAGVGTKGGVQS